MTEVGMDMRLEFHSCSSNTLCVVDIYIAVDCHGWSSIINIQKEVFSFHFQFQFNLTSTTCV